MPAITPDDARAAEGLSERPEGVSVTVTREPLTYEPDAPRSYFHDLVMATRGDATASGRVQKHAEELRVILVDRETRARRRAETEGVQLRANPSRLDGQGGYAAPPLWLIDQTASAPRPARALSALMPGFVLPAGAGEVSVPRLTTGAAVGVAQDGAPVPGQDFADAAATSPVVAFAGQSDVPLQLLEQSPPGAYLDAAIFRDLTGDYDFKLERMLANGSGANGEFLGFLNVPAGTGLATTITYTDASPTAAELIPFCGQAAAQLGNKRGLGPETWLLRTSRKAWITSSAWPNLGWPLLTYPDAEDNAIPATLGAGTNEDAIAAVRPSDMLLLESVPRVRVDRESLSGTLGVRLQLLGYAAALTARYPTSIATVRGTGLIVQSGF